MHLEVFDIFETRYKEVTQNTPLPVAMTGESAPAQMYAWRNSDSYWDKLLLDAGFSNSLLVRQHTLSLGPGDGINNTTSKLMAPNGDQVLYHPSWGFTYNGSTWDRQRGNLDLTLLSSASRSSSQNSPDQVNYNARGVLVLLNVTANPGGAETLTLELQAKNGVTSTYFPLVNTGAVITAANGMRGLMVYPGAVETVAGADLWVQGLALPRNWRVAVQNSGAGSWTYSLAATLML
jgi:hypothetical protein